VDGSVVLSGIIYSGSAKQKKNIVYFKERQQVFKAYRYLSVF
jgi:hypothetical protein